MRALLIVGLAACGFSGPHLGPGDGASGSDGPTSEAGVMMEAGAPDTMPDPTPDATFDAPLPTGLIAWYQLDSGPPAVDSTGHNHTGACSNACPGVVMPGKIGSAYTFSGQRIDVPDTTTLRPTTFTVAVWVSFSAFPAGGDSYACPFGKYQGSGQGNSWQLCLHFANPGYEWQFNTQHAAFNFLIAQASVQLGAWHHVAATFANNDKRLYVDGVQVAMSAPAGAIMYDGGAVTLGADISSGAISSPVSGMVDDARIYDHVLPIAEIAALAAP